jgi:O-antigen/teichoic acid export membrane protein
MFKKIMDLLRHTSVYAAGSIAAQVVGVILVPVYTRVFSPGQYGVIDIIATVSALLTLLFIAGQDSAVARYFIDAGSAKGKREVASTGILYVAASAFLVVLILAPFSAVLAQELFKSGDYGLVFLLGLLVVPFAVTTNMFNNLLRFKFQPVKSAVLSVGVPLVQTLLTILLVVFWNSGIIGVYIAALITNLTASVAGYLLTRNEISITISAGTLKKLLSFGLPYLVLSLSLYVMTYSSRYLLNYFSGLAEVGLYGVGYRIAAVIGMVTAGFELAWGPFVMSTYREDDSGRLFARIFDYTSVVVCLAILGLSLFSRELLLLFATPAYADAFRVVPFIAASIVTYTLGAYFAIGIGLTGRTIHIGWTGLLAALVNIAAGILLIPLWGMVGAAAASFVSYLLLSTILLAISQKLRYVPFRFGRNVLLYVATAAIVATVYLMLMDTVSWPNFFYKLLVMLCFLPLPFALGLIGRSEIKYLAGAVRRVMGRS